MVDKSEVTRHLEKRGRLKLNQLMVYTLPILGVSFLMGPVAIIQGIYAKYFGLSLTTIASVLLIARLFDAVTDPVIGFFSDRHYARYGSRKGYVVFGAILFVVSCYFLFVPNGLDGSEALSPVSSFYFLTWFLCFYLAWTLFEIPHLAWGSDLAWSAKDKNTIFSFRALAYSFGGLLFYIIPLLPIFETHAFTPETLTWAVLAAALITLPCLYLAMKVVPASRSSLNIHARMTEDESPIKNETLFTQVRMIFLLIFRNKPFLILISAFLFSGAGVGMTIALWFIFADSFLGLGEKLPLIYMLVSGAAMLSVAMWHKAAAMLGMRVSWGMGILAIMGGMFGASMLIPDETSWLTLMFLQGLMTCGWMAISIFVPVLVSDAVDYASLKFRKNYAATYFAIYTFVTKANLAIGGAVGFAIAGMYGFDATASTHSPEQIYGLHLAVAYVPGVIISASLIFIALTPLNKRRRKIILRRLDSRGPSQT